MESRPLSPLLLFSFSPLLLLLFAYLAATLALNLAAPPHCDIGAEEDIGCARGFETRERDGERSFRWTDGAAAVFLHAPGYGGPPLLEVALAAPRGPGDTSAVVFLSAGALQVPLDIAAPRRYQLLVPDAPLGGDTLRVAVASDTWRPPRDRRTLGVQVDDVRLRRSDGLRLAGPLHTLALLALGLAALRFTAPWRRRHASFFLALLVIALAATLWALLPARVAPFLPGLALIGGLAALLLPRSFAGLPAPRGREAGGEGREAGGEGALLFAMLLSTLVETAFAAGALRGPWITVGVLAQAAVTLVAIWWVRNALLALPVLLGVALAVRLLAFAARLLAGGAGSDPDVELFYSYGRATLELGLPVAEYPSGALLPWALLALPGSRELFALLLPLLNTVCDLAIVWGLHTIAVVSQERILFDDSLAARAENAATGSDAFILLPSSFILFYALSPLLLPFWWGKFDSLPGALLVLGLAAFFANRPAACGALLGFGGAVKWVPWLAAPAIVVHGLRTSNEKRRRRSFLRFSASPLLLFSTAGLIAVAAASLPFALRDLAAFLAPYTLQGGRPIIGESLWFLPAVLLEPGLLAGLTHPWSNVESSPVPPTITVAVQALALLATLLPVLLLSPDRRRTLVFAALAPAAFLLLNRIFSPQYVLLITSSALAAGTTVLRGREPLLLIVLLTVAQAANLLVWPHTSRGWLAASAVLFATAIGVVTWLAVRAVQPERAAEAGERRTTG